jgi:hypothetical protein
MIDVSANLGRFGLTGAKGSIGLGQECLKVGESGHGDIDDVAPNSLLTTRC